MAITHNQVLQWRQKIKEQDLMDSLVILSDSYQQEILDGWFRIDKGQSVFNEMPNPYKILYAEFQKFLGDD